MYEKFEELLKSKGLTITDVSKGSGVGRSSIYEWRSGVHVPNQKNLKKIADFLGVTVDYFLYDDVDKAWEEHKDSVEQLDVQELFDMMCDAVVKRVMNQDFHDFDRDTYKRRMKHYSDFLISEMKDGNKHND